MEYVTVEYKDGTRRVVNEIFAYEHRNELTILREEDIKDVVSEKSKIQRLRDKCDALGIEYHHKNAEKTLERKIAKATKE